MTQAVMIIGPNGVGKTKQAYELARRQKGEVINLDRTYLYRGFPITTGLQDTLSEVGVLRHFYEVLEPHEKSFGREEFSRMVEQRCSDIVKWGGLPIAEGASTLYVTDLLKTNAKRKIFKHIIGLKFGDESDIERKYRRRIDQAFADGLAEELSTKRSAFESSYLIKDCHFAVPTIDYLDGKLSLVDAKERILDRCLKYKDLQMSLFSQAPEIKWIDVTETTDSYQMLENIAKS